MAKYNLTKIKTRHSYTIDEMAALFAINEKTIQRWVNDGLQPMVPNRRPHLFMGEQVKQFLIGIRKAKRTKLKANEIYCLACKKAVEPINVHTEETTHCIGKNNRPQLRASGDCPTCNKKIMRILSTSPEQTT